MQYGLFPAATIVLICGIAALWRHRGDLTAQLVTPAFIGLTTSAAMTVSGFVLGAMITADTTLVPAHYHANIGAVSVAYMAVLLVLLPRLGAAGRWPRLAAWQPLLYGAGQMTFVLGLAVAGTLGQAARKTYGTEQQLHTSAEWVGLIIVGIGGVIALTGGILFIAISAEALHRLLQPFAAVSETSLSEVPDSRLHPRSNAARERAERATAQPATDVSHHRP
jgi:hypothetical protein